MNADNPNPDGLQRDHERALALVSAGDWKQAHELVQSYQDDMSCLIHAYLHRVEGDDGNADYWYRRAGDVRPNNSLTDEYERLERLLHSRR